MGHTAAVSELLGGVGALGIGDQNYYWQNPTSCVVIVMKLKSHSLPRCLSVRGCLLLAP